MAYHLLTVLELTRERPDLKALHDRASLKFKKLAQDPRLFATDYRHLPSRPTDSTRLAFLSATRHEHDRVTSKCFFRFAAHLKIATGGPGWPSVSPTKDPRRCM
jgi:hypothetical protein